MAGRLTGKTALITGGGSGIGRAASLAFTAEGARVIVSDISTQGGEETVRMVKTAGGDAAFVKADVSEATQTQALIGEAVKAYGRLDCAFNNAGIEGTLTLTADMTEEDWDRTIRINLKGAWLCMKYEIQQMLKQGGGSIVNTASTYGLVGGFRMPAYIASKHGIVGVTRAAALEYAKAGIRVNCVCPGGIDTPMMDRVLDGRPEIEPAILETQKMGRMGKPEEIAAAAVWLSSDEASFVTGHALCVDGAWTAH